MSDIVIGLAAIFGTVVVFGGAKKLNRRFPHPLTLPILVSAFLLVLVLLIFHIPYDTYMIGGRWIDQLLGPAVVALALPLYKQRKMLQAYAWPLIIGVLFGTVIGISSGFSLAYLAGFSTEIIYSMIPKSVTTPVAVGIVNTIGGIPALTAVFVIIAGIYGAVLQSPLFNWLGLRHFLGRGVGMGAASHAIGTAKSMETSEPEGAVSTVAMTLSAIVMSILSPLFVQFFY